ncbi:MAG: response regulator transcription factor [candidate division KSB1 bacterium]|nr:response regulator transcription factor [candidate division KSB1 bacterium]MDZ7273244.1 response regulator transcription factor [candidate division KSB1 bacterium]MDZ7285346.1 response regulator transcription factor [candidate division KSB1 bacterium]MDZ7298378.1 response regulator transcription factor [candidate division KSB1 bacterium]MDZ7306456.1 response regulator transcription factor [candidate division KSB1 bacterium]
MKKILLVEDDASIALGLEGALSDEGYVVKVARTGPDGYQLAREWRPDLIVLDLMMPGMSGMEICKRLRDEGHTVPIIMVTARAEEDDKVLGLELGANDYVTKPFSLRELLARVKAHLRPVEGGSNGRTASAASHYRFGNVVVDFKRHEVRRNGMLQELTNREFRLLAYFIRHPGELIARERLLEEIWGYNVFPNTRTVDNHILRLRKHIEPDPENPRYIKTIRGAGYLFDPQG